MDAVVMGLIIEWRPVIMIDRGATAVMRRDRQRPDDEEQSIFTCVYYNLKAHHCWY